MKYKPSAISRRSKYNAKKTVLDGITFDSIREARRYRELSLLQRAGKISNLRRQVPFILIPEQREPDAVGARGGIIKGKLIERKVEYIADFVYNDENGDEVIEDAKGVRTPDYVIKRKLALFMKGIRIKEV
jgi:hypothetical protein